MGNFLDELKKAVDTGNFNSEAAKKINEIDKNANEVKGLFLTEEEKMQVEKLHVIPEISEEKIILANTEYENQMIMTKKQDNINRLVVTLIEIEDMVKMSIDDMFSHIIELEDKFEKEFENEDPMVGELYQKINDIKSKYSIFTNN